MSMTEFLYFFSSFIIQTKEVLVQVLTMSDTATALSFFYHLVGIPSPNEPASVVFNELGPAVVDRRPAGRPTVKKELSW